MKQSAEDKMRQNFFSQQKKTKKYFADPKNAKQIKVIAKLLRTMRKMPRPYRVFKGYLG